jgi:HPt (histidine-containing phosphotransfer) domain-containing protein
MQDDQQSGGDDMNSVPRLDPATFNEVYESVSEHAHTVKALYRTFLSNAVHLLDELKTAESDAIRQKRLHTLKGSAAMMGAARMARLAAEVQESGATTLSDAMHDYLDQLDDELAATRRVIEAQLNLLGQDERH